MSSSSAFGKPTRACITCNHRKLKCDAATVGLPCSRCITQGYPETCALANRRRRKPAISGTGKRRVLARLSARAQLVQQDDAKSVDQLQDSNDPSDKHPAPFANWDLIDGRGVHYMSILGRLAHDEQTCAPGNSDTKSHTNWLERESESQIDNPASQIMRLSTADREYLERRGALSLPPKPCCEAMLRRHFTTVYPHIPIYDYIAFLDSYASGSFSWFLMQSILASAVPFTTLDVLADCGFNDRSTALEYFFSNAVKLYDFGCEESQLIRLQGSLILSTVLVSYSIDKDFRFWHHNAVRLAIRLGLHKDHVTDEKAPVIRNLYQRIWSVICCRELVFSIIQLEAPRLIQHDTRPAHEMKWWSEHIPPRHASMLPEWTEDQKCYSHEHLKLAIIASRWQGVLRSLEQGGKSARQNIDKEISSSFAAWRESLPKATTSDHGVLKNRPQEISRATLEASSYRFECIFYRLLISHSVASGHARDRSDAFRRRLRTAVFELDTIVSRLLVADLLRFANLNMLGCVTCLVALHIETVLDPTEPPITKSLTVTYIRRSELILQKICEVIPAMERNLRLLHRYLDQKRIDAAMTVDMSPVEPAESLKEGDVRVQEAQQSGIDTQDSGQVDMNEPRPSLTNSEIRLPVDEASEGLGDMDDWLDGLLWLDYLKDSTLMPN
ncbi:hypothetical protein HDV57DRAFT_506626 [Trichoderma longibrachiatum]|uniref:Zn(2)-C6 fungal-type domain-containing protein n=1 Tax=Trichoderma longibrachiatum ATCC 18648 TaxID=983965 RepID=A0A2T4BP53_TRILO|nr:hypothetical protein M440DRAFT_1155166 [Trichoderma longibrachiatum ATCC 18648]